MDEALQVVIAAVVPLKVTVLVPCVAPKFVPAIVTVVSTGPKAGVRLAIVGVVPPVTPKEKPALDTPLTVTTTLPVVAPVGTMATMDVLLQLEIVAVLPLNVTVLEPCVVPKLVPVMVTDEPGAPEIGETLVTTGVARTVNVTPFEAMPFSVTTTLPVVAPVGTTATIEVALHVETVAAVPLNFTVLEPWDEPKFVPVIVTDVPTGPDVGDRLPIEGVGRTVKVMPFEATPFTVTTRLPVVAPEGTTATIEVALQLETVAAVPLNLTVLEPCVEPKFVPVIVTDVPITPEVGEMLPMVGVRRTVNETPFDATPLIVTTTLPVVAPVGTTAVIDVLLQLEIVAVLPLNVTVLEPWVEPKFVPVIVTDAPTGPEAGERLLIVGVGT